MMLRNDKTSLLSAGAHIARGSKRYVIWFYLLNLALALCGAAAFGEQAHAILDHSLYSDRLLHGFDLVAFLELIYRPEFGSTTGVTVPAICCAGLFFLATMLLLPGVFLGYAADHRLPRGEFYRACGQNIWRFVRLFFFFVIIAGATSGILGTIQYFLVTAADESSNERLPFFVQVTCMGIIFLVLTAIRIWFDLAQIQVVVADQGRVLKAITGAYRGTERYRIRLLGNYLAIALLAGVALFIGIWVWIEIVPSASVLGAFIVGQAILLILLAARFLQRACAVAFYRDYMTAIIVEREILPSASLPVVSLPDEGGPAPLPQT
jgi:hypothetical protein